MIFLVQYDLNYLPDVPSIDLKTIAEIFNEIGRVCFEFIKYSHTHIAFISISYILVYIYILIRR